MTTLFSDNFNRANSGSLGANWAEKTTNDGTIASNQLKVADAGNGGIVTTTTTAHAAVADCKATFTRITGTGFDGGPIVRKQAADTFYYVDVVAGASSHDFYRRTAGSDTVVGSATFTSAANDTLSLEVSGTGATVTLKAYKNASLQATITDTTGSRITGAGQVGVISWVGVSGILIDDFLVEDLATFVAGAATMAGTGALSAIGESTAAGTATLAATGALAAQGEAVTPAAASLAGAAALAAQGASAVDSAASLSGAGGLNASGQAITDATASLTGSGALNASSDSSATAILAGQGQMLAIGASTAAAVAMAAGVGSLFAIGAVFVATPAIRTVSPAREDRTAAPAGEDRTILVHGESRVVTPE